MFETPVFSVGERKCRGPDNSFKTFTVLDASDWAIVIPVIKTDKGNCFVMVRQWRHGETSLSLEFPGGVFESGEDALSAAKRELAEETAFTPGKILKLAVCNPNPALMSNHVHFFLAEDLAPLKAQDLDEDEFVAVEIIPMDEVIANMGNPPYIHALMSAALGLYLREMARR
ncbi:DNA mismatch repair protein MutT [Spirochaetia bacterium]|nr:DNA mismatch repair protein MutT [Spirochaetia bacterium]